MTRYSAWCPPLDAATQHRTLFGACAGARRLRRRARRDLAPVTADAHDQYVEIVDWRDVDVAIPCTDTQGVFVARLGIFSNADRLQAIVDAARSARVTRDARMSLATVPAPKPLISPDPELFDQARTLADEGFYCRCGACADYRRRREAARG